MRKAILGLVLATGVTGAACAGDYVVVGSTDPSVRPGLELNAGQRVALSAGQTLRLINASGEVTTLRGGPEGAVAPRAGAPADPTRLAQFRMLIDPPPTSKTFGGRRSGVCPDPATLVSLDQILVVQSGGCTTEAKAALDAYVAAH
ncbi:hypothetical protein [Phenylobacterium sp.]|jgi:hypothetical protein|uniref:hypothetical protein n=1 Tax=Phenylobacterium sp. TaxID=1871053 RepID=UPI002EDB04CB